MTLTELRYIVAVARQRHFGRAAEACHVSQPTLSVAVRKLEDELGVTLFERGKTEVTATPTGLRIVEQAQRVLEEVETLLRIASSDEDELGAPLKLGVIYTVGPYLLPHLIRRLRELAPELVLLISENFTDQLTEDLRAGDLDAAILSLPYERSGIVTQRLYDEPFVVAMPPAHRLAAHASIAPADLQDETLLLLKARNCFRDQVLSACPNCAPGAAMGGMARTLEGSSIETIRQMTAAGAGITVLPRTSVEPPGRLAGLIDIRPFADPAPMRTVALAYRRTFTRPRAIAALRRAVIESGLPGVRCYPA